MKQQIAVLYLGSSSAPRAQLLHDAQIDFALIAHGSDELLPQGDMSFADYVGAIARDKMKHIRSDDVPARDGEVAFFLTADTLVQLAKTQRILSKPRDRADALAMLALFEEPQEAVVVTGYCLEKRAWSNGRWQTVEQRAETVRACVVVSMPAADVLPYLERVPHALHACGGLMIEGYGAQFVFAIHGSYTAVLGLPMYELRNSLTQLGFWR